MAQLFRHGRHKCTTANRPRGAPSGTHAPALVPHQRQRDYYKKHQEIIADYNRQKDRVTIEETFGRLVDFDDFVWQRSVVGAMFAAVA